MTNRQKEFYRLYRRGYSMGMIARKYKINRSTVCRTIAFAEKNIRDAERLIAETKRYDSEGGNADFGD